MIKDLQAQETNSQEVIEVLIGNGKVKVWVLAMATNMYIVGRDGDLSKVEEIRVRKLGKEKEEANDK